MSRRRLSPLTLRILAVNLVPLAGLALGLLYLDRYEAGLVTGRLEGMTVEARIVAGALGANATVDPFTGRPMLNTGLSQVLVRRLVAVSGNRARLFDTGAQLVADSNQVPGLGGVFVQDLPPPEPDSDTVVDRAAGWFYDLIGDTPVPSAVPQLSADDRAVVERAIRGEIVRIADPRLGQPPQLIVAAPVQRVREVLGVLVLSAEGTEIVAQVRAQRRAVGGLIVSVAVITTLLSLYLAGTIARPVRRLAEAADRVRTGYRRRTQLPDFSSRKDEIGDLSRALGQMTATLYDRLDAIEAFAADVAHEVRTPLTSLKSAVETLPRAKTDERRTLLIDLIVSDVDRLEKLITDISEASRVDADLSRAEVEPIDLVALTRAVIDSLPGGRPPGAEAPRVVLTEPGSSVPVMGVGSRLGQVLRNLIENAVSFSPPGGIVAVAVTYDAARARARVRVDDEGPGLPPNPDRIFERFYSDRPDHGGVGMDGHSGLGLSISRQIVEAHDGTLTAETRLGDDEATVLGARFEVLLHLASP